MFIVSWPFCHSRLMHSLMSSIVLLASMSKYDASFCQHFQMSTNGACAELVTFHLYRRLWSALSFSRVMYLKSLITFLRRWETYKQSMGRSWFKERGPRKNRSQNTGAMSTQALCMRRKITRLHKNKVTAFKIEHWFGLTSYQIF